MTDEKLVERVYDALPKMGADEEPYYSLSAIRLILNTAEQERQGGVHPSPAQ